MFTPQFFAALRKAHRRSRGHGWHRPHAGAVDLHAQRALPGGGRGRHRSRQRRPGRLHTDARGPRAGARQHQKGRHRRPPGRQRLLRRTGQRHRPRQRRAGPPGGPDQGVARARATGTRQARGRRDRRTHDRLRQGSGRHRRRCRRGGHVRGHHAAADAARGADLLPVVARRLRAGAVLGDRGHLAARRAGAAALRHRPDRPVGAIPDLCHRRQPRGTEDQRRQRRCVRRPRQHGGGTAHVPPAAGAGGGGAARRPGRLRHHPHDPGAGDP